MQLEKRGTRPVQPLPLPDAGTPSDERKLDKQVTEEDVCSMDGLARLDKAASSAELLRDVIPREIVRLQKPSGWLMRIHQAPQPECIDE